MRRTMILAAAILATGCATVSKFTIANRLEQLGLSSDRAQCMSDELDNRLNDQQLADFAQFTVTLTKPKSSIALLNNLKSIDDPAIASAVALSGVSCILR